MSRAPPNPCPYLMSRTPAGGKEDPDPARPIDLPSQNLCQCLAPLGPGTWVPFPLSGSTARGELGRLKTPPQRPMGRSRESCLGREN